MRGLIVALAGVVLLGIARCIAAPPATMPVATARTVVETATQQAVAALRDGNLTRVQKGQQVRQIVDEHMDWETLARLTLGPKWRELPDEQRAQFTQEFRKHVLAIYWRAIDQYGDQDVVVLDDRQEVRGDWTVQSRILGRKQEDGTRRNVGQINYRLRQTDQDWRVIDATIEGISVAGIFRSQFQAVMANGGMERLMQLLREKNAAADESQRESNAGK